uniref:Secreted protein n=1 Tax=Steinernema glaseri TaxID=37863 RepID=A0A1I8A5R8_9BILA
MGTPSIIILWWMRHRPSILFCSKNEASQFQEWASFGSFPPKSHIEAPVVISDLYPPFFRFPTASSTSLVQTVFPEFRKSP